MKITGKCNYDPVALATGKDRTRIIRRHAHTLAIASLSFQPFLDGRMRKISNQLSATVHADPYYWVRNKYPFASAEELERLLEHSRELLNQVPTAFTNLLQTTIAKIESELIVTRQSPGWAILNICYSDIAEHFKKIKREHRDLQISAWSPHCSITRGETPQHPQHWCKYQDAEIKIEIQPDVHKNKKGYFWLNVVSKDLEKIRTELGLPPRPSPPFHITIGKTTV
jgi:hypothetical protein